VTLSGLLLVIGGVSTLVWAGLLLLSVPGRRKLGRLGQDRSAWPTTDLPPVTAMVPVRDEVAGIDACVRGILEQDYPADRLKLLVADDRSVDGTRERLESLRRTHRDRLTVLPVDTLPDGWLGKPHALHRLAQAHADDLADWLWFVDSDVRCEPSALRRVMSLALLREYGAVSLLPDMVMPTGLERLVGPAAAATWLTVFAAPHTNHPDRAAEKAIANGQFMLIRRPALLRAGGHAAVRDKTCEDVELFRRMKADGVGVRLFLSDGLARTRMHATWGQMFNGWARNFAGTARHRPLRLVPAILLMATALMGPGVLVTGLVLQAPLLYWMALPAIGLPGVWFAQACRSAGGSRGSTVVAFLLHPISAGLVLVLLLNALRACAGGKVRWRGSSVRA
jgi:cellulose synthase/poly-beta-1,6-N-acetylglucosamine synthase-like glycosyltransferase